MKRGEFRSVQQWWNVGKVQIQQLCNQYNLNATREVTQSIKDLETEIVELEGLSSSTGNQSQFQALKAKINALADPLAGLRAQGALVRSRFQNIKEMDAPSKCVVNLERNLLSKSTHSLPTFS